MKVYYIKDDKCKTIYEPLSKEQELKLIKAGVTAIVVYETFSNPISVFAATSISESVQPLVNIVIDLAEPVSYIFMVKGFLQWCSGKELEGKKAIKSAMTGYLGVQFMPQIFKIIKAIKLN